MKKDENLPHRVMCMFERRGPDGVVRVAGNICCAADPRFQPGREIAEPLLRHLAQWSRREGCGCRLAVGRMAAAPGGTGQDSMACAEATVLMPSGDTVIVGISIGTFKLGMIGEPAFQGAVIKTDERILQVRRLSDLPGMLPPLNGVSRQPLLRADHERESKGTSRSSNGDQTCLICSLIRRKWLCASSHLRPWRRSTMYTDVSAPKFFGAG